MTGPEKHALVVGGTGMLAGVTLSLAEEGYVVSLMSRRPEALAARHPAIFPYAVNYHATAALEAALQTALEAHGPVDLAVVWVHSTAPRAPIIIARAVGEPGKPGRFFHILSSAYTHPPTKGLALRARFTSFSQMSYHQVILGFVVLPGGSRWLTHAEISQGVLQALQTDAIFLILGQVEPWSAHP